MILHFNLNIRDQWGQDIIDELGVSGKIEVYAGVMPAGGGTPGTLLAELTLAATAGTVTAGVVTFNTITGDPAANADGDASWCRAMTAADDFVFDGDVGQVGSGAFLELNTIHLVSGGPVGIASITLTAPNA